MHYLLAIVVVSLKCHHLQTSIPCLPITQCIKFGKTKLSLPDKFSPRSHHSQPFPGNSGQGHSYLLLTRQSVCPEKMREKHQTVCSAVYSSQYTRAFLHALTHAGYILKTHFKKSETLVISSTQVLSCL